MKRMMLTGAMVGMGMGFGLGWVRQIPLAEAFVHGCVAAYCGGLLMRWWGRIWFRGLREAYEERLAAAIAEESADNTSSSGRS